VLVKENQPTRYDDVVVHFDPPAACAPLRLLDRREARTSD
jgi:hypothetical protein